jgi:hypothetical protein
MEAERIIERIESDTLLLKNLSKYRGKEVEILIFPREEPGRPMTLKSLYGVLKANVDGLDFQRAARAEW